MQFFYHCCVLICFKDSANLYLVLFSLSVLLSVCHPFVLQSVCLFVHLVLSTLIIIGNYDIFIKLNPFICTSLNARRSSKNIILATFAVHPTIAFSFLHSLLLNSNLKNFYLISHILVFVITSFGFTLQVDKWLRHYTFFIICNYLATKFLPFTMV